MTSAVSQLYEPMIGRELAAIPRAVAAFREQASSEDLFRAVARFGVLAFAPTEHCRHALLACLAVHELREETGARYDEWLTECAVYVSQSRLPWSEPPIVEVPVATDEDGTAVALHRAIAAGDRHGGEKWLARRMGDAGFARGFFSQAAEDLSAFGRNLVAAVAAWKLAAIFGERERYGILRTAVWEWLSPREAEEPSRGEVVDPGELGERLAARMVDQRGSIESFHDFLLYDAGIAATAISANPEITGQVSRKLSSAVNQPASRGKATLLSSGLLAPYRLARDYGEAVLAAAAARHLEGEISPSLLDEVRTAALVNLETAPSFEEWSFA